MDRKIKVMNHKGKKAFWTSNNIEMNFPEVNHKNQE